MMGLKTLKLKTKISGEDFFIILLSLVWLRTSVVSYFFSFLKVIPVIGGLSDVLETIIYLLAICLAIPYIMKKIKPRDMLYFILIPALYFINIQIFTDTATYLRENAIYILGVNFAAYFVGVSMDDTQDDKFINCMYRCSQIAIVAFLIYFAIFGFSPEEGRTNAENMGLAYRILPHATLMALYSFTNKKIIDIGLTIIGAVLVLACGTRGAVLSFIAFLLVFVVFFYKVKHKIVFLAAGAGALTVGYIYFENIAVAIINFLNRFGLSTRVIENFLSGTTLIDAPRQKINDWIMGAIQSHPFRGYGIAGDRNLIPTVVYSHSFWLEMWVSYGWIVGTLVMVVIAVLIVKAIRDGSDIEKGFIIAMIFGGGLFKLLVSSSYLLEFQFFMLIGYLVCICRRRKASSAFVWRES